MNQQQTIEEFFGKLQRQIRVFNDVYKKKYPDLKLIQEEWEEHFNYFCNREYKE
jgi:hypothetical protein